MDSFAYIVRDRARNLLLAYRTHHLSTIAEAPSPTALHRLVEADELLTATNFGTVKYGWDLPRMTVIPRSLFIDADRRDYLGQLTLLSLDDDVAEDWLNEHEAHLLYAINGQQHAAAKAQFAGATMCHLAKGLLSAWGMRSKRLGEASVSVSLRGRRLFVAVFRNGSLQFFNTFSIATQEDALYYVLLAYEQTGLLPSKSPLYLCGEIVESAELFQLLYTYVQDVHFCRYGAPPALAPELASLPTHLYYDLLCLG